MKPVKAGRGISLSERTLAVPAQNHPLQRTRAGFASVLRLFDYRLLGMALPFFCSDLIGRTIISNRLETQLICHFFNSVTLFVVAGIVLFWQHRYQRKLTYSGLASTLGTCVLSVAYVLLALAITFQIPNLFIAGAMLGGAGLTNCYTKWFSLFSRVPLQVATVSLLLAYSLGSLLRLVLSYTAPLTTLLLAAGAVLVFQIFFLRSQKSLERSSTTSDSEDGADAKTGPTVTVEALKASKGLDFQTDFRGLLPFVAILMLYSLILALVRAVNAETQYLITPNTLNLILRTGFPLVLLLFVIPGKGTVRFITLYQLSLVLVVTAVFVIRLFSESNTVLAIALTSFIRGLIILFLFLALIQIAQDRNLSPLAIVGIGWGTYVLAQGVGLFTYLRLGLILDGDFALNITFLLVALSMIVLLLMGRRGAPSLTAAPSSATAPFQTSADTLSHAENTEKHEHFAHFGQHHGLTERELEVLVLICQGRSKRHIAEAFVISENTVRGHVKNLHIKCEVHTKQELIDLFESFEQPETPR
jgi:DNA-binding CsgD family transcriptional regulator